MREHLGVKIIFALVVLVFLGHQAYSSLYKPIKTEIADYFEVVSGVSAQGVIIRNEIVIYKIILLKFLILFPFYKTTILFAN